MKQRLLTLWLPVVLWMALIFLGSHQQGLPAPQNHWLDVLIKKTAHVLEYATLGFLLLRGWLGTLANGRSGAVTRITDALDNESVARKASLLTVLTGGLYAVSDELHQMLVPTRSGNARDIVIDTLAVTAAVAIAYLWRRSRLRSPQKS